MLQYFKRNYVQIVELSVLFGREENVFLECIYCGVNLAYDITNELKYTVA